MMEVSPGHGTRSLSLCPPQVFHCCLDRACKTHAKQLKSDGRGYQMSTSRICLVGRAHHQVSQHPEPDPPEVHTSTGGVRPAQPDLSLQQNLTHLRYLPRS